MNPLSPQLSPYQPPPVRSGHSVWTYLGIILAVVLVVGGLAFVGLVAISGFLLFSVACNDLADERIDRINLPGQRPLGAGLLTRETEILRLVAKGLTYPQIAARLSLSFRTVQNHAQNTLIKLQLHNKAQLVRYAMEQGIE